MTALGAILALWYRVKGTISVETVTAPTTEVLYCAAFTFSRTLGTAVGDWAADMGGLGYGGGAGLFAAGLLVILALSRWTRVSQVALFWAGFILTRPLGATVGNFPDKPIADGGLALSRSPASLVIAIFIIVGLIVLPLRNGRHPGDPQAEAG